MNISKHCPGCNRDLPVENFHRNQSTNDGLASYCRGCVNANAKLPRNRKMRREVNKRYASSEKGRATNNKAQRTQRKRHPKKVAARQAVATAVKEGKIDPAISFFCKVCNRPAQHYHHSSYEKENQLNVEILCSSCHRDAHKVR